MLLLGKHRRHNAEAPFFYLYITTKYFTTKYSHSKNIMRNKHESDFETEDKNIRMLKLREMIARLVKLN